jgi:hypothetical protein
MKRMLIGTVAAGALVIGGHAALCADVDVSVPTLFNYWNGAYLGVMGGWGLTTTRGLNASGDFGGGQIGYNYQIGKLDDWHRNAQEVAAAQGQNEKPR